MRLEGTGRLICYATFRITAISSYRHLGKHLMVASPRLSAFTGGPLPRQHFPVLQGGERGAFDATVEALASEPRNSGLIRHAGKSVVVVSHGVTKERKDEVGVGS